MTSARREISIPLTSALSTKRCQNNFRTNRSSDDWFLSNHPRRNAARGARLALRPTRHLVFTTITWYGRIRQRKSPSSSLHRTRLVPIFRSSESASNVTRIRHDSFFFLQPMNASRIIQNVHMYVNSTSVDSYIFNILKIIQNKI